MGVCIGSRYFSRLECMLSYIVQLFFVEIGTRSARADGEPTGEAPNTVLNVIKVSDARSFMLLALL